MFNDESYIETAGAKTSNGGKELVFFFFFVLTWSYFVFFEWETSLGLRLNRHCWGFEPVCEWYETAGSVEPVEAAEIRRKETKPAMEKGEERVRESRWVKPGWTSHYHRNTSVDEDNPRLFTSVDFRGCLDFELTTHMVPKLWSLVHFDPSILKTFQTIDGVLI